MWIKKTNIEFNKYQIIIFIKRLLFYFLLFFIPITISERYSCSDTHPSTPVYFDDLILELPFIALISIVLSIIISIYKIYKPTTVLCNKCNKVKENDGTTQCECGGEYIDMNMMKWVSDDHTDC